MKLSRPVGPPSWRWVTPYATRVATNAMTPAENGAINAGRTTLLKTTPKSMAVSEAPMSVAPMSPPKRAWDELDGSPRSQVNMFHAMAPIRPAKTIGRKPAPERESSRMIPCEIVFETSVDRNAPTRLRTAARATATFGRRAPVAIGVAMAFAVSWKPLVKSKKSASAMMSATMIAVVSTMNFP